MGKFIVIEGIDGSGKTSHSKALAQTLGGAWMRFPERSTFYGQIIDAWLKGAWKAKVADTVSADMPMEWAKHLDAAVFQAVQTANRLEMLDHLTSLLTEPGPVVCDRYWPSGVAYGTADGLDPDLLIEMHRLLPQPRLFVLMDLPYEAAMKRLSNSSKHLEVYETKPPDYTRIVWAGYDRLWNAEARYAPAVWARFSIDPDWPFAETQARLVAFVKERLGLTAGDEA